MWPHHHRCQELWPRYIGASNRQTVDHKPSKAPPDGAGICAGQTAVPGYRPPVWPAAEQKEAVSAAFWRPDPTKLLSQLSTQFQMQATERRFQQERQEQQNSMINQLMEQMMLLKCFRPPSVTEPRRTEMTPSPTPSHPPFAPPYPPGPPVFRGPPVVVWFSWRSGPSTRWSDISRERAITHNTVSKFSGDRPTKTLKLQHLTET